MSLEQLHLLKVYLINARNDLDTIYFDEYIFCCIQFKCQQNGSWLYCRNFVMSFGCFFWFIHWNLFYWSTQLWCCHIETCNLTLSCYVHVYLMLAIEVRLLKFLSLISPHVKYYVFCEIIDIFADWLVSKQRPRCDCGPDWYLWPDKKLQLL